MFKQKYLKYYNKIIQNGGFICSICNRTGHEIKDNDNSNEFVELYPCLHILCMNCMLDLRRRNINECPLCRNIFYNGNKIENQE